jgi:arginine decarboxylase
MYKLGAPLKYLDVGGGLGVDYDGSQTNFASSMNYTVQEYANDVVYAIKEICDAGGVPHPTIVSESGRAIAAHHSVLIVDVLG